MNTVQCSRTSQSLKSLVGSIFPRHRGWLSGRVTTRLTFVESARGPMCRRGRGGLRRAGEFGSEALEPADCVGVRCVEHPNPNMDSYGKSEA